MTLILNKDHHLLPILINKDIKCITTDEARHQDIRALRIGILNLMPKAEQYEYSLLNPLGKSVLQIDPVWIRLHDHNYSSSDKTHLKDHYISFDEAIKNKHLDGLILTGAPVEEIPFEEVTYWNELTEILIYAKKNIVSTFGICWGGLVLAKLLGLEKIEFARKLFGVFEGYNLKRNHPITGEMDDIFFCPQSRHSGIEDKVLLKAAKDGLINLLAHSNDAGYFIFESMDGKFISHLGHPEYEVNRMIEESIRDKKFGRKDVDPPQNFTPDRPVNRWRSHRTEFFTQWIKYVYQNTKY